MASPMYLATSEFQKWQVPRDLPLLEFKSGQSRDLPLLEFKSGKSQGTCHFIRSKMASPKGLATS